MLIVLSPAKALNFEGAPQQAPLSVPQMGEQTAELAAAARRLRVSDLKRMMSLSDDLAKLSRDRFQAFDPRSDDGLQAAFAFNGDVYQGLRARELDRKALAWARRTTCASSRASTACCARSTPSSPTGWRWGCG